MSEPSEEHRAEAAPRRRRRVPDGARRWGARLAVVLLGTACAAAALLGLGWVRHDVGPVTAELEVRLSPSGGAEVALPPLGRLELATHAGPLRVRAAVVDVRPDEVTALLQRGATSASLRAGVTDDVRDAVRELALRAVGVSLAGAALGCALVYRRWRPVVGGVASAAVALAACAGSAVATWDSRALAEPRFTGLLSEAPRLVGSVSAATSALDAHARRVTELTSNVARLYAALGDAPSGPGDDAVRVLWVSDVHNNVATYDVMEELVEQFDVAAVVDTGDSTDLGSPVENLLHQPMGGFGVPYVWVRGNHDSLGTQAYVSGLPGVVVLDRGAVVEVEGVRFAGTGDPRFTPVKRVAGDEGAAAQLEAAGEVVADAVRGADEAVDVALVHEPGMAPPLHGVVPLVLDGHVHERRARVVDGTLELTQGSSGGAGLRSFDSGEPLPLEMSVLHFDPSTHVLLAVDEITVDALGSRGVTVERRTADSYVEQLVADGEQGGEDGEEQDGEDGGSRPPGDLDDLDLDDLGGRPDADEPSDEPSTEPSGGATTGASP